jgi:MFS family permease
MKWVYTVSVGIFTLGSVLCTFAPTSTAFILGRAVAGMFLSPAGYVAILTKRRLRGSRCRRGHDAVHSSVFSNAGQAEVEWHRTFFLRCFWLFRDNFL